MNRVEQIAQATQAGHDGELLPLQRAEFETPVLCCPAVVTAVTATVAATFAAYNAGNMVSDFVGEHNNPEVDPALLCGKSGKELLNIRQGGVRR
ncbi:hypothetical protein [Prauserella cavernicola]|uniref:Uncharacterized protein n=1 Tax=Prauserella cavernicola TaxID=2800127 RepID=A0A934QXC6_9PSEU|nr:hypothetical protein [Prauserella cavernicola]MBK1787264.1 hypothetical protein [Prauserella cavernicola]